MYVDDDSPVSITTSNKEDVNKVKTSEDLEVEFALMTNQIKLALCHTDSPIDVLSVIEELQTISAVKDKNCLIKMWLRMSLQLKNYGKD